MTLILVAANPHFVVQVSDRRLTSGSKIVSDEAGKSIHWTLPEAQFLLGYTGLAHIGRKPMTHVLAELLLRVGSASFFDAGRAVPMISDELTRVFDDPWVRRLPVSSRRLSVMMTGFIGQRGPLQAYFTNFQVWGSHDEPEASEVFDGSFAQPKDGEAWPTLFQWLGAWDVIDPPSIEALRPLLTQARPPRAVRDKLLDLLPKWAADSSGRVGLQANSVIMRSGTSQSEDRYHSIHASHRTHSVMRVCRRRVKTDQGAATEN
jgi:hypothetical protein